MKTANRKSFKSPVNRPFGLETLAVIVIIIVLQGAEGAFLFPDMAFHSIHRTGGSSSYVIASLVEEPYLYGNGSGYLADLMQVMAARYSRIKRGAIKFNYEIVPVKTWDELIKRANSEHVQISFGLISPYLLRIDPKFYGMHSSMPIVQTSLKFITGITNTSEWPNSETKLKSKLSTLVNVKGSPEDRLLEYKKRSSNGGHRKGSRNHHQHPEWQQMLQQQKLENQHLEHQQQHQQLHKLQLPRQQQKTKLQQQQQLHKLQLKALEDRGYYDMDTLARALDHIRLHGNDILVTDASVADCIIAHEKSPNLQSVCPKRRILHSAHLHYGFFGRNSSLLKFLNDLLKVTHRDGELEPLWLKYFSNVRQCD